MLRQVQEQAILRAYTDWYEKQADQMALEPVTEKTARMAEVEYQLKMAAL